MIEILAIILIFIGINGPQLIRDAFSRRGPP